MRRLAIATMTAVLAAGTMPGAALAQAYPNKPLRLVISFPPGGPNDTLGRLMTAWLSPRLGQPIEVVNRPGRSGNIGTEEVVKAAPDGYTLLLVGPANAIGPAMDPNLPFSFLRDIAPVAGITREALVLVTHPSVPAKDMKELMAFLGAGGGAAKMRLASTGNGSSPHVTAELFMMMTGLKMAVTHYGGGGPALKAMIAGDSDIMFEPMSASIEPVRTGKLRALAVTTATRSTALPEVPILADTVPGYEASAVTGFGVPAGTPAAAIDRLNREVQAAFADAGMKAKLLDTGGEPLPGSPADFGRLMQAETEKWGRVVRAAQGTK